MVKYFTAPNPLHSLSQIMKYLKINSLSHLYWNLKIFHIRIISFSKDQVFAQKKEYH